MDASRVTAFVLAGGEGRRLLPLTADRPKPALEAGGCRIVDFVLSNLRNSGVRSVYVLLQYKPQALLGHLERHWSPSAGPMAVVPVVGEDFAGTADAVARNLHLLRAPADAVAVFAADHVYRMDLRPMLAFHEARAAQATVAALPVPLAQARGFGVIETGEGQRVAAFEEKPAQPAPLPGDPSRAFVSMGNYVFRPDALRRALGQTLAAGEHDFGRHVMPRLAREGGLFAYDYAADTVPGLQPHEQPGYWRDVGTLAAYLGALDDLHGPTPALDTRNPAWPIGPLDERAAAASRREPFRAQSALRRDATA